MFKKFLPFAFLIAIIYACSSTTENEPEIEDNFNRSEMLQNIADNIIIPAYTDFSTKLTNLKTAGETFTTTPNQVNLEALRTSWFTAYKVWQHIEMFDIGKAETLQYKFYMNIYPLTVADVEANISTGNYDLNSVNNHDAQGFPALDYLLNGVGATDAEILEKYTTATNKDNYRNYITDVLNQMNSLTQQVVADFKSNKATFVNSVSNTATSSFNKLVNDYIFYYEKGLRANKFGIPAGVFSTDPLPEKVEAFYKNDVSKELALEALKAVINIFEGTHYNNTTKGISYKNYLESLERADIGSAISNQLATAKSTINLLDNSFSIQIESDNVKMTKSYDELQKVTVLLKVDMLQAFNINVDYVDADGD
ncbi:peptidase M75 superfamily protein [Polaribacter aestuariivivens]|uniref:Peptidase M75 superfamily protein n=1 Tax=Polaribacter aestuariivivens TaxID=2304626 RepID=A0A5S3N7E4_9FLAO|nr:imelysin family protein [Polaribacter aestuariivivens]TMM31067.1 peptidase M75 superfamily protein [Polaribacter aestuariivivens]